MSNPFEFSQTYWTETDSKQFNKLSSKELDKKIDTAKRWMEKFPQHSIGKWYYEKLLAVRASRIGKKK